MPKPFQSQFLNRTLDHLELECPKCNRNFEQLCIVEDRQEMTCPFCGLKQKASQFLSQQTVEQMLILARYKMSLACSKTEEKS